MIINNKATKDESLKFHKNFSLLEVGDKVEGKISHKIEGLIPFKEDSEIIISNKSGSKTIPLNIPIPLEFSFDEIDDNDFIEVTNGIIMVLWKDVPYNKNFLGLSFKSAGNGGSTNPADLISDDDPNNIELGNDGKLKSLNKLWRTINNQIPIEENENIKRSGPINLLWKDNNDFNSTKIFSIGNEDNSERTFAIYQLDLDKWLGSGGDVFQIESRYFEDIPYGTGIPYAGNLILAMAPSNINDLTCAFNLVGAQLNGTTRLNRPIFGISNGFNNSTPSEKLFHFMHSGRFKAWKHGKGNLLGNLSYFAGWDSDGNTLDVPFSELLNLITNNSGQIKLNWADGDEPNSGAGFSANTPKQIVLNNNYTVSSFPTTTYPYLANDLIGGQNLINPTTLYLRELLSGQSILWRFTCSYQNKAGNNNGSIVVRIYNPNPLSSFDLDLDMPAPSTTTAKESELIGVSIADSLSLDPLYGYTVECETSFNDGNFILEINNIVAEYLAVDNFLK